MDQWQQELRTKFGFKFALFDSDTLHENRKQLEIGANPWAVEPRVIASMDFIKRREGAFRDLSSTKWDVVILDEAHHLSAGRAEEDITDRHRLGRWLAEATDALLLLTATPHNGYDEGFVSLLGMLEPSLVSPDGTIQFERYRRYLVRRLKRHIRNENGTPKFLERQVRPVPVRLTASETALQEAVLSQARDLEDLAQQTRRQIDAEAIRLVATILRKRAASSRRALKSTLEQRRTNLEERIEEIEVQKDHLRALRRGDALPDEALTRLERDAHKSYLSVVRRLGGQARRAADEIEALERLDSLVQGCEHEPDSKLAQLLQQLEGLHGEHTDDKVIVFSEYTDTVSAIVDILRARPEYADRVCVLTGEMTRTERDNILNQFEQPNKLILVATDAAGEGLNLQKHCHHIIHFELPWNPNRLEQRNGRVDRYGQNHTPIIEFLYVEDTYEGEVLAMLVEKIERQVQRLGSVGDVLGQIQVERIDEILTRTPRDVRTAISQAEHDLEEEIARITRGSVASVLGDGTVDQSELQAARRAAERATAESVDLVTFLQRAVQQADGHFEHHSNRIRVVTPLTWLSAMVRREYANLVPVSPDSVSEESPENILDGDHPLIGAAIRWVKSRRFDPQDDHRLSYVRTTTITSPDLVATFLVQLRDGMGQEIERVEAVRITPALSASHDSGADQEALRADSEGNVSAPVLVNLFADWWLRARDAALAEAQRRVAEWQHSVLIGRQVTQHDLSRELDEWNLASRRAILGDQADLFEAQRPPALRRRLRQHEERYRQRANYLQRRLQFTDPVVEPIGVLLRVPATAAGGQQ
jgi:superfamily II DNA or RNA helicase